MLRVDVERVTRFRPRSNDAGFDDPHPWRAALILGVVAIAAGMLWSMLVAPHFGHRHSGWVVPGDAWTSLRAAHYVGRGTYPLIYQTGTQHDLFEAGPLLPLFLAPVALLGDVFHLSEGYPFPVRHPSLWPAFGPYALATAIPLMYAARRLATQLGLRSRRLGLQCAVLVLGFVPMAVVYGHYEDVIALSLVLLALRELFAERGLRGALYLGVAIAFKQWALLAVPVYVVGCPPAIRIRATLTSIVPPVLLMSAFLATDYRYASQALLHPTTFPTLGHAALWISPSTEYVHAGPARAVAVVVALLVAWMIRRDPGPSTVLSAVGCVLLARIFCEAAVHAYYAAPAIVLLLFTTQRRRDLVSSAALGAGLLLMFPFHPNRWLWWTAVVVLAVIITRRHVYQLMKHHTDASWEVKRSLPVGSPS